MTTKQESITAVYDDKKVLVAIIHRNEELRKAIVFKVEEMTDDEIAELIENKNKKDE